MSPRWNRSVRLHIGTDAVRAVARGGWPRAATIAETHRAVASATAAAAGMVPHAQAIEAALDELGAAVRMKGARLEAEIASTLLHLDVVEGDFGAQSDRQLQGVATACVSEMLGDEAAQRAVRWYLQPDDRHLLIAALAEDWIALVQSAATAAGLRFASLEPAFVARWNESGKAMRAGNGIFAVCDAAELAIAAVADGAIAAISVGAGVGLQADAPRASAKPAPAPSRTSRIVSSGFSPERQGVATMDERVDRFLSGRGQDPDLQSAFVLVAADSPPMAASTRWSVIASPELRQ